MVDSKFTQNLSRFNHLPWTPILNGPEYFELGVTIIELELNGSYRNSNSGLNPTNDERALFGII